MTLLVVHPAADNERGPEYLESLLGDWMTMSQGNGIQLGQSSREGRVQFLLDAPEHCQRIIAMQIANAYPRSQVEVNWQATRAAPLLYCTWCSDSTSVPRGN